MSESYTVTHDETARKYTLLITLTTKAKIVVSHDYPTLPAKIVDYDGEHEDTITYIPARWYEKVVERFTKPGPIIIKENGGGVLIGLVD